MYVRTSAVQVMNGLRIPDTPIVVDCWSLRDVHPRSLFFLSHMHADHTSGLTESWPHPIHCTPASAKLLVHKFKINPKLVVELEVDETKILRFNYSEDHVTITVTTLDANHCPGSAMFLFEGYFGTILYTGDFRFSPTMLSPHTMLNGNKTIDVLYLDNTYCDPQCQFPSREEATDSMISLINSHPDKVVLIGLYTLGKENLLVEIAQRLKTWIGVTEERFERLKLLEMPNVFKTSMDECRIQVFPKYMVEKGLLAEMRDENYLAILPTCLYTGQGAPPLPKDNPSLKVVPYSDHSSFQELRRFVKALQPKCVRPIVKKFTGDKGTVTRLRANMAIFDDLLDTAGSHNYSVPLGVQKLLSVRAHSNTKPGPNPKLPVSSVKRANSGSRTGTKASPKGVQYYSPTKSLEPTKPTEVDITAEQPSKESLAVNVEKKSVCVLRTYAKNSDDDSSSSEVVLQSSQAAITYCSNKVQEAKKNDWSSGRASSCARLIPFANLQLHRHQNKEISSNSDTNVEMQEAHKEPSTKLRTDNPGSTREDSTTVEDPKPQRSKILTAMESAVSSFVNAEADHIEFPCPKKARVTLVKVVTGNVPPQQISSGTSPKQIRTNTLQSDVINTDTLSEQNEPPEALTNTLQSDTINTLSEQNEPPEARTNTLQSDTINTDTLTEQNEPSEARTNTLQSDTINTLSKQNEPPEARTNTLQSDTINTDTLMEQNEPSEAHTNTLQSDTIHTYTLTEQNEPSEARTNTLQSDTINTLSEQNEPPEAMEIDESPFPTVVKQTAPTERPDLVRDNTIKMFDTTQPNFATNEAHEMKPSVEANHLQPSVQGSALKQPQADLAPSIDHVMDGAERDEIIQVRRVLQRTDASLYPDILKLVASFMDYENVSRVLERSSNRLAGKFPFKNIERLATKYLSKSSMDTSSTCTAPVDHEWGPQHCVSKESGICECKDDRYCLLSSLRILYEFDS